MFKVRFKERLFIIFFACFLAIYPPTVKYQQVQALEWAIPTIAFDTALKFLLGLLGVSITSKALHDNVDWEEVRQNCIDYQIQQGNDAVAVSEWWEDVIHGTLNQASDCWTSFKAWVNSFLTTEIPSTSVSDSVLSVLPDIDLSTASSDFLNYNFSFGYYYQSSTSYQFYFFNSDYTYTFNDTGTRFTLSRVVPSTDWFLTYTISSGQVSIRSRNTTSYTAEPSGIATYFYHMDYPSSISNYHEWDIFSGVPNEGIFDSANDKIQDTAITTGDTTTTAIPDTLPLPWDNVSDTAEGVSEVIDSLQEQVAEGVLSLEDYWEKIQEMLDALAIDTTTEETLPVTQNPDTGETEKIEDVASENVSNTAFTLSGLEKVFPFCIPWDIYSFVTLLVAEPVAPVINYPIYNPVTDEDINITIDFSEWETVVVLFRYVLDFLLIIGLLLLARQLSGAGGDD